ncbi:PHP domain-containing protein [Halarchaeum sp. CBA1220]|uniref:PHP domain-containing protein n=1 Tax=Halarchaeum sp. CBA1220 TaxID=1853682 RepID=UPI000F3A8297|nr:PHP domain-containing protein [Halarchaeum sp. CBA1220]QLC33345.1 PHP domain-containing protein [Halarchaeum sp. CBA1220]
MPYADLHVHTTASDGELTLETLPEAARNAGVEAVAVTDHDTVHPGLDAPLTERGGVEVVRGIELRVDAPTQRVDLLGYGVRETDALRAELERLQDDRVERGRRIVERVEAELGVDLGVDVHEGFGRPHVARAVVEHPDTDYGTVSAVFADLIGHDGPCYVARDVTDFERGRALLREACGAVGLAHPLRYADPDAALALCETLDAVEAHYPYDRPVGREADSHADGPARVRRAVAEHDLLALGGSDAHGRELGTVGVERGEYRRLRRRIGD